MTTDRTANHHPACTGPDGSCICAAPVRRAVTVIADVVTGQVKVDTSEWTDDDPRWAAITDETFGLLTGINVGPWGADEESVSRADDGLADLGYERVTVWTSHGTWWTAEVTRTPERKP